MISFKKYTDIVGDIANKLKVTKDIAVNALIKAQERGINPLKWQRNISLLTTFASIVAEYDPTVEEEVELDEVYGTVKISGKRGRLVQHSPGEVVFVGNKKQAEKNLKQLKKDGGDGYIMQGVTIKVGEKVKGVEEDRDYKDEYNKFQSSEKMRKYRAELNKYNREKGTYGNGDGKDASHKDGKIVGMEDQSTNRGRAEKSRLVGSKRK